jgi:hypothetical protein
MVIVDGSELKQCRASVIEQIEETTSTKLCDDPPPLMLYRDPNLDEWLLLSRASLADLVGAAADSTIDLRLQTKGMQSANPPTPPLDTIVIDSSDRWRIAVQCASNLAVGNCQAECIAKLVQILEEANNKSQFKWVVAIRWRLSDQAILAQLLNCFSSKVRAYVTEGRRLDYGELADLGSLLYLVGYKGNEVQYQRALRKENFTQIEESQFIQLSMKLLSNMESCPDDERLANITRKCLETIRFLLLDGQDRECSGKKARKLVIEHGFLELVQQLLVALYPVTNDRERINKGENGGYTSSKTEKVCLSLLPLLANDSESRPRLNCRDLTEPLLALLRNKACRLRGPRMYASLMLCRVLDEDVLDQLDDEMTDTAHYLASSIERKLKGKFDFEHLHNILCVTKTLSSSNKNKARFAPLMAVLFEILGKPFKPIDPLPGAAATFEAHLDTYPMSLELACRPVASLLSPQVKQLAAEILLSLSFNDANSTAIKGTSTWVSQLKSLQWKPTLQREIHGILFKLGLPADDTQKNRRGTHSCQRLLSYTSSRVATGVTTRGKAASAADVLPQEPKVKVMLSYCWAQQETIKQIYEALVGQGFDVWLDIHEMARTAPGVLEAMSQAIDQADVVIMAVSREYKDSANCRLEAEYAHVQKKPMLFMMMQADFTAPSGWLGMLVGASLWYGFFDPAQPLARKVKPLSDAIIRQAAPQPQPSPSSPASAHSVVGSSD